MILRRWRGAVRPEDVEAYLAHQSETGVRGYRATPGNLGVLVLRRPVGHLVEVITLSLWESMAAVRGFAGERPEVAVFYPGDDELLAEKDPHVDHFEVSEGDLDPGLLGQLAHLPG
ncbi:antibiotic biosynthesis monooxygenase [Nocardioides sp. zg-DK7169]|uniref:antibiotic biosynthesis monooxygenase n=1 Tax=Nocardioides sp. zg-DK7169 TaxID=2736600 RepID=UPI001552398B|nr:antibiotic biosynthesis monooxygenase [Nocardioides sp. zg-DK7169]NPC98187.1 antibiotic biosynthesis monooxygenase [Nocardioides sp. zg-DK7169]